MSEARIFRFKIEAYTPATIPMARLAEYMTELAVMLGERPHVHFVELESGSTNLVHKIEYEAVPKVRERVAATRRGEGPPEAMSAFRNINRKLREDNGSGALIEDGAEILEFPGKRAAQPTTFGALNQEGTLDGVVIKVGGRNELVPVHLESGPIVYSTCQAQRAVAKRLAGHIFTSELRVKGTGKWLRDESGAWILERFTISDFEVLDSEALATVVSELRTIAGNDWEKVADPWAELHAIRNGLSEH